MVCPRCGTVNPEGARFCQQCGARLRPDDRDERLDPFLPQDLLAKLEAAREGRAMEGERRIVTMLFCDVQGSTAMAESLDPEDWAEIMNGAFERLIAPVYRYEGTLARLMGDAIFAFFGAPIAHEDDPQRAVAAGLEIVEGIQGYRERLKADRRLDLNVRVGINTGPVVVGQVGSDLRLEYTAMGDAVNVAARMEQTAEPGTVQITAETHRLVAPYFETESRGDVEVKGKSEPVAAHRVLGRAGPAAPSVARRSGSPLVGRDREMAELQAAVREVQSGGGRIVSLIGEAGLGKSRLIEETRRVWAELRPDDPSPAARLHSLWETWQCVSYDTTRPYAQYRRILAEFAGIRDADPPDVVLDKLSALVEPDAASEWLEPHLRVWRSLFGVLEPGEAPLEGEAFRRAITDLVTGGTRAFGEEPRLMVFEDLHWCDEASMDLLMETARVVDDLPCLALFAYRPDRTAQSWRLKQWLETEYPHRSSELQLSPLSREESGALVDGLLPSERRPDAVREGILERTEGNPLFLEEMAAAVLEREAPGDGALAIPSSLQALITARLDTLEEETRRTLQLASVIGIAFSEPVLRAVSGDGDDLGRRLGTLERVGLIAETARVPEREYAFRHSLIHEATYDTILLRTRRALHRRVGEALEETAPGRMEEFAALLARHFREAGDDERTLRYATAAGDAAARLYANADAAAQYATAIEAAARLERAEPALRHLYPSRGRALELAGRHGEAAADYEAMRSLAEGVGDRRAALQAELALATLHSTPTPAFDPVRGRELSERTIALARELDEPLAESKALWNLMLLNVFGGGDSHEALEAGTRSLEIARELDAREQMAFTLNDLWRPHAAMGDLAAARASLEEATPIWRELGNLPMLSENLASRGTLVWLAGDRLGSLELCREAIAISEEIGNSWGQAYALMGVAGVERDAGEMSAAIATMRACIEIAERAGFVPALATVRADLASLLANLGDLDGARALLDEALAVARERQPIALPWVMGIVAEVHLLAGELDEAEAAGAGTYQVTLPGPLQSMIGIRLAIVIGRVTAGRGDHARAIEVADDVLERLRRLEIRQFVAEALLVRGVSLAATGASEEAELALRRARAHAEEIGCRRILWEILLELSEVAAARGRDADAAELRAEAASTVEEIAHQIDERDLRASFLARPEVRAARSTQ